MILPRRTLEQRILVVLSTENKSTRTQMRYDEMHW